MRHLLLLAVFIPILVLGQTDDRYLAGAVPVENGKVVFSTEINTPGLSQNEVFDRILSWAHQNFADDKNRVVYVDRNEGEIAVVGEEFLVFSSSALSLDRSLINYRIIIECHNEKCDLQINSIRYTYNVSYQKEPEKYIAEEWIVDKYALNKNKLNRISGKFRKATIDMVDEKFQSASLYMGVVPATVPAIAVTPARPVAPPAPIVQQEAPAKEGYISFSPDKIPQAILDILPQSKVYLSAGNNEQSAEGEISWKGIGNMFGKHISTITVNAESPIYKSLQTGESYTLNFFNETNKETPWMIIECNKQGETSEGAERTIIGEIIHIWLK